MKGRHWTEEEDRLLADTVLRHVREGGNQLNAFEEVAQKVNRTPGACGFRWNAVIRKKEADAFHKAKQERIAKQLRRKQNSTLSLKDVIRHLREFESEYRMAWDRVSELEQELAEKKKRLREAEAEHRRLTEEWKAFENFQHEIEDRYTSLLRLFRTARRWEEQGVDAQQEPLDASVEKPEYKPIGSDAGSEKEANS
ncbi:transcription factor, RsfA family [Melghirimyces thermohalophilus]|uniref:Transcription factor, RsfA family n=1 Tax=Melghirimyces thermohalophilus TaxID=1236220 RepID=A0A1G6KTI5_9BACL|nr:Myb-like DNA-binding domain-containing protein [Melghirimyces thermohalophilus]SDC34091.1 transcription factor, RsfA family [Melghirimyces thermohalophilus]